MSEWQPIETAPKDGRDILVWMPLGDGRGNPTVAVVDWYVANGESHWRIAEGVFGPLALDFPPTHWMPLPEPPTAPPTASEPGQS